MLSFQAKLIKSEYRISKSETNPKFKYQMFKTLNTILIYAKRSFFPSTQENMSVFWIFNFCHLNLFRVSDFEFRI